jgi:signal transduction histidine kinase
MKAPLDDPSTEITRLQRCVNDLVSLLALPALWSGREPSQIVDTVLDALLGMLGLEFIYVRLKDCVGGLPIEIIRTAQSAGQPTRRQQICQALDHWLLNNAEKWPPQAWIHIGDADLSIAPFGFGLQGEIGVIVAGSERVDFPMQTERLLLCVAANQAWTGLQEARLLGEQKRVASELDQRVARRTAELEAANEELRREIAERFLVEQRLKQSIEDREWTQTLLAGEKQLLEMIASGSPLPDVLKALCGFVEGAAPECYCGFYPIDWRGPTFRYGVAPSLPPSYIAPIEGLPVHCGVAPCGVAAFRKEQVIAEDIESDARWHASDYRKHVLAHGLRSVWSTPILSREGTVLGTFCVYQRKPARPSPRQQELIAQVTHIASIAIERERSEAAVKRSEAFLAEAQRLSRIGSFSWRLATRELTWSEELYRIFEFPQSVRVTLDLLRTRVHPNDLPLFNDVVHKARDVHGDFEYEQRLQMPDRSVKYLHVSAHATHDKEGRLEYIGAAQDVTQRRLSEEALADARSELARVSRITTLGALTASIAHEVNQPLAGIMTNAGACMRMLNADPPNVDGALETVRRTIRDANRASDVISRLRTLFAKGEPNVDSLDLNEAAQEVIALSLSELQRTHVIVRSELSDDLPRVTGDRVQLQQVIVNLLRNALEAMGEVDDRPRELMIRTERDGDDRVRLTVRDAGVGLGPDPPERLFHAFYTTKDGGTGVGLAISRSIIESHQGRLWAERNDGPGAMFSFSIPRSSAGATNPLTLGALKTFAATDAALQMGSR